MKCKVRLSRRYPHSPADLPFALLFVRSSFGDRTEVPFSIDTGADYTSIPISLARRLGIGFRQDEANRGSVSGLVGQTTRYRDQIHLRLLDCHFAWPCDFVASAGPASVRRYGVIGRAGFVDDFGFCI